MKILIMYYSKTGHTQEAAEAVAEGIRAAGAEVTLGSVEKFDASIIAESDAVILGSPCWAGSLTSNGVAKPILKAAKSLAPDSLTGKRCGGFAVHSKKGGETTVKTLGELLAQKGCTDFRAGPIVKAGVPGSLWTGPAVKPEGIERLRAYGATFVA